MDTIVAAMKYMGSIKGGLIVRALPCGETNDALHIASAAIAKMDVLLTWNCHHMDNPHTLPKTISIIQKAGYLCPWIMTPMTFLENKNMEVPND